MHNERHSRLYFPEEMQHFIMPSHNMQSEWAGVIPCEFQQGFYDGDAVFKAAVGSELSNERRRIFPEPFFYNEWNILIR